MLVSMKRTQIYLPEQQLDQLKKMALRNDTSVSEMIRRCVGEKISVGRQRPSPVTEPRYLNAGEALLSIADEAEKKGIKGPSDLAASMDIYLYGGKV